MWSFQKQRPEAKCSGNPERERKEAGPGGAPLMQDQKADAQTQIEKESQGAKNHGARLERGVQLSVPYDGQTQSCEGDGRGGAKEARETLRLQEVSKNCKERNHGAAQQKPKDERSHSKQCSFRDCAMADSPLARRSTRTIVRVKFVSRHTSRSRRLPWHRSSEAGPARSGP